MMAALLFLQRSFFCLRIADVDAFRDGALQPFFDNLLSCKLFFSADCAQQLISYASPLRNHEKSDTDSKEPPDDERECCRRRKTLFFGHELFVSFNHSPVSSIIRQPIAFNWHVVTLDVSAPQT